jgi:hypothetical protein
MGQSFTAEKVNGSSDAEERQAVIGFMAELDSMRAAITDFPNRDPADILATIAGTAGRLAEIRAWLWRANTGRCTALRTREVDPLRDDLDLQFRVWSRKIALLEWELKMSTGGV